MRTSTCTSCGRAMVRLTRRIKQVPAGYLRAYGRGLCCGCATRERRGLTGPSAPRTLAPDTCAICARPMVPRGHKVKKGFVRHVSHGLCNGCASRLRYGLTGPVQHPHRRSQRKHRGLEIDEMAVERAVRPHWVTPKLNLAERRVAIDYLLSHRYTSEEITRRIGCTTRCVDRRRGQLKRAAETAAERNVAA
jgi:hypothetical protein